MLLTKLYYVIEFLTKLYCYPIQLEKPYHTTWWNTILGFTS